MVQLIYVTSPESQQIYVWKVLNQTKYPTLELIQIIQTPGSAQSMVIHYNKKFLYVGVRPKYNIITYYINYLGLLKNIGSIEIFSSSTFLTSDLKSTFLYCASYQDNSVTVIPIKPSGMLSSPIQRINNLLGCHSTNIDKYQKLLWVPCLQEDTIRLFKIQQSGMLITPKNLNFIQIDIGSGPRHMVFHNKINYAFLINEFKSTVSVIKYDVFKKKIDVIQTSNIIPNNVITKKYWASDIHIHPNGRWLYCSDRSINIISILEISNISKQLKFVDYQYTETQPRGFLIDPQGKFLIVAGQISNYIALYKINTSNGKITMLSRYQSGKGPIWIKIISLN